MKKVILIISVLTLITLGLLLYIKYNKKVSPAVTNPIAISSNEQPPEAVRMAFLNIGQGDATFITFPDGQQMLVDCAVDNIVLEALGRVMKFYDRDIDYLLVTHPDNDHYGGCIDVLNRYDVKRVIYNGLQKPNESFWRTFNQAIEEERGSGAQYQVIEATSTLEIAGVKLTFLYPDHAIAQNPFVPGETKASDNNTSIVFKLSYGNEDVLLTGDMELELEQYLLGKYRSELAAEVLKVGHHGSNSSSGQKFLEAIIPEYSIISSGLGNKYGHPARRILKRLERFGTKVLRTDTEGDILMDVTKDGIYIKN